MRRLPDWPKRLVAVEERIRDWPFVWGRHDCALATLLVLEEITGARVGAVPGDGWSSALSAVRFIRDHGTRSLLGLADQVAGTVGLSRINPARACRGDIVLAGEGRDEALGWIGSDGQPTFLAADGYVRHPRRAVRVAWQVP